MKATEREVRAPEKSIKIQVHQASLFRPPRSWLDVIKFLTTRFLPYQTPRYRPFKGEPYPKRTGLYAKAFAWLKENRTWINNLEWVKRRGSISSSIGSSNWPTFTGVDELAIESFWYAGGRGVNMGDMVFAINPAKKEGQHGYYVYKRVVGVEGYTTTRRLGNLGTSHLKAKMALRF